MIRKLRMIMLLLLASQAAYCQSTKTFKGTVTAKGVGVPNAIVLLRTVKDTVELLSTSTTADGSYSISAADNAAMQLKVTADGYQPAIKVLTGARSEVVDIALEPAVTLSAVTVSSKKPTLEYKADRTIFNVENSITAIGGDALEALKKTPGILVVNNDISIAGKSSVSVMINGRMQQLSGQDLIQLLHSIPADNLSKIEVITNPPAKYDAEGNSGIVNLVTKKTLKKGFKGSATAGYMYNVLGSPDASALLNYRGKNFNISGNANVGILSWKYTDRMTSYTDAQRWEQALTIYNQNKSATAQVGGEYNISKTSIIGLQLTEGRSHAENNDNTTTNVFNIGTNKTDSTLYTNGATHEYYRGKHTLNLNYEWKIDTTGKKLNVDADYFTQVAEKRRESTTQDYRDGFLSGADFNSHLFADPSITIRSVKADVEWPTNIASFSFGGKISAVDNQANNNYSLYNGSDYVVDTTRTNLFSYAEQIKAVYISGQRTIGKYDFQAGLRAEQTITNTWSPTTGQRNRNEYVKLFPTGYVQYRLSEKHVFSLSFSRRINRPGYNLLNPFRFYYSTSNYQVGNPTLQPSFINALEFGYRWKSNYNIKLFGKQTDNYWDRLIQTDPVTGATVLTRANIGVVRAAGLLINTQFQVTKWWETRNSINAIYSSSVLQYYGTSTTLTGLNEWVECGNSFNLNKSRTLSAEVNGYYYTPRQKDFKKWGEMSNIEIGIKALFLDKNLVVALDLDDLLRRAYWQQTNVINNATEFSYDNGRGGRLSVTYKFGNKVLRSGRSRNSINEEIQRAN